MKKKILAKAGFAATAIFAAAIFIGGGNLESKL